MKTLENYLYESILESKKVSATDAIKILKAIGKGPVPTDRDGRKMTTGFIRKGDNIQFVNSNYVALCDCAFMESESKEFEYDILVFNTFVKDSENNPTLMTIGLEINVDTHNWEGEWWPADGWDEMKPYKELKDLAKAAGLQLEWDGEIISVKMK